MSAVKETLILCDGGGKCPYGVAYAHGDGRVKTAKQQRSTYHKDGWLFRKGRDYCPDCVKRLFSAEAPDATE